MTNEPGKQVRDITFSIKDKIGASHHFRPEDGIYTCSVNHEGGTNKPYLVHNLHWTTSVEAEVPKEKAEALAAADAQHMKEVDSGGEA